MDVFDPSMELRGLLARNPRDVVIVVGAGVTIGALRGSPLVDLTTWQGFLHSGLEHVRGLRLRGDAELAQIRRRLEGADPREWVEAAEQITDALGGPAGGEMLAWLRRTVGAFAENIGDRSVLDALRELQIRGALLATVNYDGVLEAVTGLRPVTWRETARVERVIRGDEPGIVHLHGYWEDPASVVFGSRSYEQVANDPHARAVLQALRMTKTLLFVGHGAGLQDPNWGSFLGWMEQVFAASAYRHYRLTREDERERVQMEHRQAQRITALGYGRGHGELAPFLRSLAPAGGSSASRPASVRSRTVVLRINIGDKEFDWLSEGTIRAQIREVLDEPDPVMLPELRRLVDRDHITAREWRAIAREIMALRDAAKAAVAEGQPVRYVVAGQAPLPVFAYLGQLMQRMGEITVINRRQGSLEWDVVGPMEGVERGEDLFEVEEPERGREQRGRVVLSIRCSNGYPYTEDMIEPSIRDEGGYLLCSYKIVNSRASHQRQPMTARELAVLLDHVRGAVAWMESRCAAMDGLVIAFGGPSWAAFWIGHTLNPYALGKRLDWPNLIGGDGRRYVRALSSPMHRAPWLDGKAKLMFVGAEPDNSTRIGGARAFSAIQQTLEREFQRSDTYELRTVGATTVREFGRELELFKPDILHLHLHGREDKQGGLIFEDERGDRKPVPPEAVVDLLKSSGCTPTLVVLSACHSAALAPLLDEIAECVVYMTGEVGYPVAIDFARMLYGALARGRTLGDAIAQGKSAVHGEWGKAENEKIGWLCAPGVEPAEVVLLHCRTR